MKSLEKAMGKVLASIAAAGCVLSDSAFAAPLEITVKDASGDSPPSLTCNGRNKSWTLEDGKLVNIYIDVFQENGDVRTFFFEPWEKSDFGDFSVKRYYIDERDEDFSEVLDLINEMEEIYSTRAKDNNPEVFEDAIYCERNLAEKFGFPEEFINYLTETLYPDSSLR